jgi:hypothetical protein
MEANLNKTHRPPNCSGPRRPPDRGADYNAFGYDPYGLVAHLAAHAYGPNWRPSHTVQQFMGQPEAPRYGPPAPYQLPYLPPGFMPNPPPLFYGLPAPPFLRPPKRFNPNIFQAARCAPRIDSMIKESELDIEAGPKDRLTLLAVENRRKQKSMQMTGSNSSADDDLEWDDTTDVESASGGDEN